MTRRLAAAALPLAATVLTATACTPGTTTPAAARATAVSASVPAQAAAISAAPACTLDFGPDGTGINGFAGTVTATVALDCTDPYDTPDPLISLTLIHGDAPTAAAAHAWQSAESHYSVTASCAPGDWAVHALYGVTVGGHALADQQWGKKLTLTADDCA